MPYVAPMHGGIHSRLLFVLRDPGPKTVDGAGSGFLCIENDDPSAERQANAFHRFGIDPSVTIPWNAYPWFINRAPKAAERQAGVEPLWSLIELLPKLDVVLLQGRDAQDSWKRLIKAHGTDAPKVTVVQTFHPSPQALWSPDAEIRAARTGHRDQAYVHVAHLLAGGCPS